MRTAFLLGAELGTKDSLIDALTITIRNGDERMSLSSRGSHMPKDGKFTDTTSLMMNTETLFQMNTSLDTKAKSTTSRSCSPCRALMTS